MLALTDFDELKSLLGLERDDIEDYPALSAIIASVYAAIETYTGRELEYKVRTEYPQADGTLVALRALPVESIASVTADGIVITADVTARRNDGMQTGRMYSGELVVTYTGGLAANKPQHASTLAALKRAATLQVMHEFQRKDHVGAESVSNEGGFTRWPQLGLLDEVKRMLNPLRHPAGLI